MKLEMIMDWMQLDQPLPPDLPAARLLLVDCADLLPEALPPRELEIMSVSADLDDALRQAMMGSPDIIVLRFSGDQVLEFLHALDYMRNASFSPYVVVIAGDDYGAVLEQCDRYYRVSVIPSSSAPRQLPPHLLRLARQRIPPS